MDKVELDKLRPRTEADVRRPPRKPQESPNKRDVGINGVVTMETKRKVEEMRREEEKKWLKLYPEIKKCVIIIPRQRFNKLNVLKLKQKTDGERGEDEGGGGKRSDDQKHHCDWMKPLEHDESDDECRLRSFVKKVEVTVGANCAPASGPRRPRGGHRESGLLRITQCPDVTLDPVDSAHHHSSLESKSALKSLKQISDDKQMDQSNKMSQTDTDHNYSIITKVPDTPDTASSQPQDAGHKDGDSHSCTTEKKNPHTIVFKKDGGGQWVLRRSEVKKEEEEEEEDEEENEDSSTNTEQVKTRRMENKQTMINTQTFFSFVESKLKANKQKGVVKAWPVAELLATGKHSIRENPCVSLQRRKRRSACRRCAACLREDCGKCIYCLDKRKFGGPEKKKQKCQLRICLVVETTKSCRPQQLNMATRTFEAKQHYWRRRRDEKDVMSKKEFRAVKRRRKWGQRWGGNGMTHRWMKKEAKEEEMKKSAQEMKGRWRRWRQRTAKTESKEDDSWTHPLIEEEDVEPKKETHPPQFLQFAVDGAAELLPEGLLTGTHMQLNLTLNSSHFAPSILSDSTLTISSLPGLLPQEASVLCGSSGLTDVPPPPSLHPLLLQPKEEEEAVEIRRKVVCEGKRMEEVCSEGVMDRGDYYEMEVEVPGSDEETLTAPSSPSDVTEVSDDVMMFSPTCERPEFISLSLGSFSLLGDGVSDEVTCGRGLLQLLRVLRKTVLPAHWVPVLADGPVLQLLQCSKLSSMANTFIHIQPDFSFCITVQNRLLPDTHSVYCKRTRRITHLSQLVSLLLELERLVVCRGSGVRFSTRRLDLRSPTCRLLLAPPCLTCLPCLLREEGEETETEEDADGSQG